MEVLNNKTIEEDEIDLRELFETIIKGKKIIFFVTFLTLVATFIYVLKIPNSYKAEAILIPTSSSSKSLGGLGGLAAMAGVSLGNSGGGLTPSVAFNSLLNDYAFMEKFVIKNSLDNYYNKENFDKEYIFAFGYRKIYDFFNSKKNTNLDKEALIYNTIKKLQSSFSISQDKKSGLLMISYTDYDRKTTVKMINLFLQDASDYLVENGLERINKRLKYFETEMNKVESFELRQSLSLMISKIVQEKVMMKSKQYYQCDLLTSAKVAYVKNKVKPKRALILVVSFITSLILSIFIIFFIEFIKKDEK